MIDAPVGRSARRFQAWLKTAVAAVSTEEMTDVLRVLSPAPFFATGMAAPAQPDRAQPSLALLAAILLAGLALTHPARAAPPPVGSDDWNIMHPYAEWVTTQHDRRGYWCCDIGDGRPVEARIASDGNHWEVHITKTHFPEEPDHWLVVPDGKITNGGNPTGTPIVWLLHGNVQCFAPPDGA